MTALLTAVFFVGFDQGMFRILREAAYRFYNSGLSLSETGGLPAVFPEGRFNTLILGSSRAHEGILPVHLFDFLGLRAYNAGGPGRFSRFNLFFYRRFKRENGIPRIVIYGLDYFLFEKLSNPTQLRWVNGPSLPEAERMEPSRLRNPGSSVLSRISLLYRAKPTLDAFWIDVLDSAAFRLEGAAGEGDLLSDVSEYRGLFGTLPPENRIRPPNWVTSRYTSFPGEEGSDLLALLEELQSDRVRVFLVAIPDWIGVYETNVEHDVYSADIQALAGRFRRTVFLDYQSPERFPVDNPDFFVDGRWGERASHLSVFGAKRFNRLLSRDIRRFLR